MSFLPRSLLIFALIVPLAILMGFSLAGPLGITSLIILGGTIMLLLTPFLLKHYHAALLASWNAFVIVFFLPGRPYLWMLLTVIGFGLMILVRALNRDTMKFHFLPSVALPLLALAIIAYITANLTGGVGLFAMGSDVFGGKKYFYIWFAVAAFFVLTSRPIPPERVNILAGLFFLGGGDRLLQQSCLHARFRFLFFVPALSY